MCQDIVDRCVKRRSASAGHGCKNWVLAEPLRNLPREFRRSVHRDVSVGEGFHEASIAHPHLRQRAQVGLDCHVDVELLSGPFAVDGRADSGGDAARSCSAAPGRPRSPTVALLRSFVTSRGPVS